MKRPVRWMVTLATASLLAGAALGELSGDLVTRGFNCLGKSPIATLLARGNALTIVP